MVTMTDFKLTPGLVSMLSQFGRNDDIVQTGEVCRLKTSAAASILNAAARLSDEDLNQLLFSMVQLLADDFTELLGTTLGLEVVSFEVIKRPAKDESLPDVIFARIGLADQQTVEVNISALAAPEPQVGHLQLLNEKPILCWLLDLRSPFYNEAFATKMGEISKLTSFRGALVGDFTLLSSVVNAISVKARSLQ